MSEDISSKLPVPDPEKCKIEQVHNFIRKTDIDVTSMVTFAGTLHAVLYMLNIPEPIIEEVFTTSDFVKQYTKAHIVNLETFFLLSNVTTEEFLQMNKFLDSPLGQKLTALKPSLFDEMYKAHRDRCLQFTNALINVLSMYSKEWLSSSGVNIDNFKEKMRDMMHNGAPQPTAKMDPSVVLKVEVEKVSPIEDKWLVWEYT